MIRLTASWKVFVHKNREILLFAPVYFFLSFIELAVKLWLTPSWFNGMLDTNHKLLLQFQYTNNEQSRLLQFYAPEFFHRVFGLTVQHSYMVTRFLFVFLAFACFHLYLRKWFSREAAFAGALFLAAVSGVALLVGRLVLEGADPAGAGQIHPMAV